MKGISGPANIQTKQLRIAQLAKEIPETYEKIKASPEASFVTIGTLVLLGYMLWPR